MKTNLKTTQKKNGLLNPKNVALISIRDNSYLSFNQMMSGLKRTIGLVAIIMTASLGSNGMYAQTEPAISSTEAIYVKGNLSDEIGALQNANIVLKGTDKGTTSNENGEFVFPEPLKKGDVLIFSYLGYEKAEIEIDESTTNIQLVLFTNEIVITGAVSVSKPYRSKR